MAINNKEYYYEHWSSYDESVPKTTAVTTTKDIQVSNTTQQTMTSNTITYLGRPGTPNRNGDSFGVEWHGGDLYEEPQPKEQHPNFKLKPGDLKWGHEQEVISSPTFGLVNHFLPMLVLETNVSFDWQGEPRHKVLVGEKEKVVNDKKLFDTKEQAEASSKFDPFDFGEAGMRTKKLNLYNNTPWKNRKQQFQWTQNDSFKAKNLWRK